MHDTQCGVRTVVSRGCHSITDDNNIHEGYLRHRQYIQYGSLKRVRKVRDKLDTVVSTVSDNSKRLIQYQLMVASLRGPCPATSVGHGGASLSSRVYS